MRTARHQIVSASFLIAFLLSIPYAKSEPALILEKVIGNPAFRHSDDIIDIVPLPDGKRVLTSADDGSVRLWELATGKELRRYVHEDSGYVWDIFLLPAAKTFLSTSGPGKQVTEWNIESGASNVLATTTNALFRVAKSPDGKLLAMGTATSCILWDIAHNREINSITRGEEKAQDAYSVCFLNGGAQLMAGFDGNGAVVKNIADMRTLHELPKECGAVYALIPDPTGKMILACTAKKGVLCINTETFLTNWEALPGKSAIYSAAWSPDGSRVAVCCNNPTGNGSAYTLFVIDPKTGLTVYSQIINTKQAHYGVAYSLDGKQILCASGNVLAKFDSTTGKRIFPAGQDEFVNVGQSWIAAPPHLKGKLLTKKQGSGLQILTAATGAPDGTWHDELNLEEMDISPDGKLIAAAGSSRIFVVDLETDKTLAVIDSSGSVRSLAFADGNKSLLTRSYSGASLHRISSGKEMALSDDFGDLSIDNIARQTTGPLFAISADALINVLDSRTCGVIGSMSLPSNVGDLTFFPQNGSAIIASCSSNLYLWAASSVDDGNSDKRIKKALTGLGARRFKEREEATEFLISQGTGSLDALNAANLADPEVRDRVARIRNAVISEKIYGQTSHILPTSFSGFSILRAHPQLPYWIGVTSHPSDTKLVIGDVQDNRIRILHSTPDLNSPRYLTFGRDNIIYTANRNGTISVYRLTP